ncbi:MAG: hypothetical protein BJ554DRAFT_1673 [Olpidium bornovanus]|uniref:Uncharacterized protein n=1 Tax=Olpidium bornovanus TaxID=278681 RepID=A0A8H7ZRN6_9FUNG|nr:MAG: hypothetical protein BJ554DRAFT_1673 [Olpidium bornovanus]
MSACTQTRRACVSTFPPSPPTVPVLSRHFRCARVYNYSDTYVSQTPLGLYLFADDTTSKSFLRAELHGQPDFKSYSALGSLVQGEDPFYFIYNGPRREDYPEVSVHYLGGNPIANALQSFIARWIEPLSLLAPGDEAGLEKNLAPNVDIDLLLKTVAVDDPRESLGVGYTSDVLPLSSISASFAAYQANKPRPVVQKIISNQKYLDQLAGYVSALVQRVFNEPFLVARVRAHAERVRPEVEWDRSLARLSPGLASPYNATDFEPGLTAAAERLAVNASVPGVGFGLLTFIQQRSAAVAALFQVQPDTSLSGPDPVVAPPTDDQRKDTSLRFSAAAPRAASSAAQTVAACAAVLALQVLAAHRRR